jgi:hypothetical protein
MKKALLLLALAAFSCSIFAQDWYDINFDNPYYLDRVYADTVSNPNCSWQVGQPDKTWFTEAWSLPNALVTDLNNSVSPGDTSRFYLWHLRDNFNPWHLFLLEFWYQMDGDSTDFGRVEISPDNGENWVNVLIQDEEYAMNWQGEKPSLKGSKHEWTHFYLDMTMWASGWEPVPIPMIADTIWFRFTYITDQNGTPNDGWMIDEFHLEDWWEGVGEIKANNLIEVYPNPASDRLFIKAQQDFTNAALQIFSSEGKRVFIDPGFSSNFLDLRSFAEGTYYLRYAADDKYAIKPFVVKH